MSLICPYEECNRTFSRQQPLSQHIRISHSVVLGYEKSDETSINKDDDVELFQDEKLFENFELFKVRYVVNSNSLIIKYVV